MEAPRVSIKSQLLPFYDTIIWFAYLALLVCASFIQGYISSAGWLMFAGCTYVLLAAHLASVCLGGKRNSLGLRAALPALVILGSILLLLLMQCLIPIENHLHERLATSAYSVEGSSGWYKPDNVWSIVPEQTHWLLMGESLMFAIFLLSLSLICSRRRVWQLVYVITAIGLFHGLVGALAKFAGLTLADKAQLDGHFTAAHGWFVNRNHYASFISITLVGGLVFQFRTLLSFQGRAYASPLLDLILTRKAFVLFTLLVAAVALILSQSRAGFLSTILSLFMAFFILGKDAHQVGRRTIVLSALLIIGSATAYFGGDLLARFDSDMLSLGERGDQWALTWSAIKKAWLLGYGGNSYATVFQAFREYGDFRQVVFNQAHNDYLHIWLEQGIVGLLLWLALVGLTLHHALRSFSGSSSTLVRCVALAASVVMMAALIQSLVDFNLQILNIRLYFFVIMAMVFAIPSIRQHKGRPKSKFLV